MSFSDSVLRPEVHARATGKLWARLRVVLRITGLAVLATMSTCSPSRSLFQQMREMGSLRVATTNSPTTYYVGPAGETGFEYELTAGLARQLGVKLEIVVASSAAEALDMVQRGRVHFAAAGVAVTPARGREFRFTRAVHKVVPQLVYRMGEKKPNNPGELEGPLMVGALTAAVEQLAALKPRHPQLSWQETEEFGVEELLLKVFQGEIGYTVADSDVLAINQRYYPQLRAAFPLAETQEVAWAFKDGRDTSLFDAGETFLAEFSGAELRRLRDRHFGHSEQVGYIGAVALATHVETRLPDYRAMFEQAGTKLQLDWRLIAAMGYQESHWDPAAVSPTGVRGIMQLTQDTARFLNVADRENPAQSIDGGARYIRRLIDLLPDVPEPDRTWLALAAYNMGVGHLRDVQQITEQRGGDPKRWVDIRENLPLLTQPRWHSKTQYGYARGHEARTFVGNVRTYFDMLVFITGGGPVPAPVEEEAPEIVEEPEKDPLNIRSPVL